MIKRVFLIVAASLLTAALALGISSYTIVHSSKYNYYESQYAICSSGYSSCMTKYYLASTYYEKAAYLSLAKEYDSLKDDWSDYMEELEDKSESLGIAAGICLFFSIGSAVLFFVFMHREKTDIIRAVAEKATENNTPDVQETKPAEVATNQSHVCQCGERFYGETCPVCGRVAQATAHCSPIDEDDLPIPATQCECGELFRGRYCPVCGKSASKPPVVDEAPSEVLNQSHVCQCGERFYGETCPVCGRTLNN